MSLRLDAALAAARHEQGFARTSFSPASANSSRLAWRLIPSAAMGTWKDARSLRELGYGRSGSPIASLISSPLTIERMEITGQQPPPSGNLFLARAADIRCPRGTDPPEFDSVARDRPIGASGYGAPAARRAGSYSLASPCEGLARDRRMEHQIPWRRTSIPACSTRAKAALYGDWSVSCNRAGHGWPRILSWLKKNGRAENPPRRYG